MSQSAQLVVVLAIGIAICAVLLYAFWRIAMNVRNLWSDSHPSEREVWVIVLVVCMTLVGAVAGAIGPLDLPIGRLFHGLFHAE